jgi:hypothetical protein
MDGNRYDGGLTMARRTRAKKAKPRDDDAVHEAAHAVVSVRLGLPLASTDILKRGRINHPGGVPTGYQALESAGYTTLEPGSADRWVDELPDPAARASLEALAAQAAAGIVAELSRGAKLDDPAHYDDRYGVVAIAGVLGLGTSSVEQPVRDFIVASIERAKDVLLQDDCRAWNTVANALLERKTLTGDEVLYLVQFTDDTGTED